jgi:hypothetical protein
MIVRHRVPVLSQHPSEAIALPLEIVGSFRYTAQDGTTIQVAGSPMISQLHRLVETTLTGEERAEVIKHHFGHYLRDLPNHNITVVSIPPRKENAASPTHQAFLSFEGVYYEPKVNAAGEVEGNLYYFPHGAGEQREANEANIQKVRTDPRFRRQREALAAAWNQNFQYILRLPEDPEQEALQSRQEEAISTLLINDYNLQTSK